jgi:hypothetical protein
MAILAGCERLEPFETVEGTEENDIRDRRRRKNVIEEKYQRTIATAG